MRNFFVLAIIFASYLISSCGFAQNSFYIGEGADITVAENAKICLKNMSLVNDGLFEPEGGTVIFLQDSSDVNLRIRGKRPPKFDNLVLNLAKSQLRLQTNVQVNGTLSFKKGRLDLGGKHLIMGKDSGRIEGEDQASYIHGAGSVRKRQQINSGRNRLGKLGLDIYSPSAHEEIQVIRKHEVITTPEGPSITRTFEVRGAKPKLKQAIFQLHYLDHEAGGTKASNMRLWQRNGNGWKSRRPIRAPQDSSFVEFSLKGRGDFKKLTLREKVQTRNVGWKVTEQHDVQVLPNPTKGPFVLVFGREIEEDLFLQIFNTQGQIAHSQPLPLGAAELKLSLAKHPPGMYFINIQTSLGEGYFSSSIVKQ